VRERWDDVYPPTTQIIRVGTAASRTGKEAKDDAAPEYVADELLVMTQAPTDEATKPGADELQEWREPGPYGEHGWTEKLGMPVWQSEPAPK